MGELEEVWSEIARIRQIVIDIAVKGCAKREGDLDLMKTLKEDIGDIKKMLSRTYFAAFGALFAVALSLLKYLWQLAYQTGKPPTP